MIPTDGTSYFSLLATSNDLEIIKQVVNRYASILEMIRSYEIGNAQKYYIIELGVCFSNRSRIELCKFIINYIPCIALHQEGSSYFLINDKDDFATALKEVYGEHKEIYFLYDLMTIKERYKLTFLSMPSLKLAPGLRLRHYEGAGLYSLIFDPGCQYLFTNENEIELENEMTGELITVDLLDGLSQLKFHLVILA